MSATVPPVSDDVILASERWYNRLVDDEKGGRALTGVLCGLLVFLASIIVIFVSDETPYNLTNYFIQYGNTLYFEISIGASFAGGILYYALTARRKSNYEDLSRLIGQAKAEPTPERLLSLAIQISSLLPKVKQGRYDDALLYGVLSFLLTIFLFPWCFIVGLVVWLYFRHEASSEYNREQARFDAWKLRLQTLP